MTKSMTLSVISLLGIVRSIRCAGAPDRILSMSMISIQCASAPDSGIWDMAFAVQQNQNLMEKRLLHIPIFWQWCTTIIFTLKSVFKHGQEEWAMKFFILPELELTDLHLHKILSAIILPLTTAPPPHAVHIAATAPSSGCCLWSTIGICCQSPTSLNLFHCGSSGRKVQMQV